MTVYATVLLGVTLGWRTIMNLVNLKRIPTEFLVGIIVAHAVMKGYRKEYGRQKPRRVSGDVIRRSIWASPLLGQLFSVSEAEVDREVERQYGADGNVAKRLVGIHELERIDA